MSQSSTELTVRPVTPMEMLQVAIAQNCDMDKLTKLMDLQERWERNEARKQFDAALAAFKEHPPELSKNKTVDFTSQKGRTTYKHATLDEVALKIGSAMSPHGLSFRWNVEQAAGKVKVTCILAHRAGHFESVQLEGEPDATGNKNSIQMVGSTITYLQRYTLLAITGMAVQDQDDDGRASEQSSPGVPSDVIAEKCEWMANAKDLEELKKLYMAAIALAEKVNDKNATQKFIAAKNLRYKELA